MNQNISNKVLLDIVKTDSRAAAFTYLRNHMITNSYPLASDRALRKFLSKIIDDDTKWRKNKSRTTSEQYETFLCECRPLPKPATCTATNSLDDINQPTTNNQPTNSFLEVAYLETSQKLGQELTSLKRKYDVAHDELLSKSKQVDEASAKTEILTENLEHKTKLLKNTSAREGYCRTKYEQLKEKLCLTEETVSELK